MRKILRSCPILIFINLAFLISWSIWVPLALDHFSMLPVLLDPNLVLAGRLFGTLGPAIAAIITASLTRGKSGSRDILSLLGRWRVHWAWYAAACLVFPALALLVAGISQLLPGPARAATVQVTAGSLSVTGFFLVISVLGEEIGWRGLALPEMQKKWTALQSSLFLGTIWTFWHLPFWCLMDSLDRFGPGYWLMNWVWILAISIYITWIMNHTGNSLLLALLFHWTYNLLSVGYLPLSNSLSAYTLLIVFSWAIALGVVWRYGPKRLVRDVHDGEKTRTICLLYFRTRVLK